MARRKSYADLQAELDSANGYIEALEARLDDIAGIATDDEDDDDFEDDEDDPRPPYFEGDQDEDDSGQDDCPDRDYAYASS